MGRVPVAQTLSTFSLPDDMSWVITSDPEFNRALDYIVHTSYSLFINGPAGTGKSVLIALAYRMLEGAVMVIGSTGVAASHLADEGIPASTVHCGLKIRPLDIFSKEYNPKDKHDVTGKNILLGVDTLLIEEVGMISASLFDHIGVLIEKAEKKRKRPIRVICFGDVLQLPPVVKSNDEVRKYYDDRYDGKQFFFSSDYYRRKRFTTVFLDTIYRQSENSFQNVLNRIRLNIATSSDLRAVNAHVEPDIGAFKEEHPLSLLLAPTVSRVKKLNEIYGKPRGSKKCIKYTAVTRGYFDWKDAGLVEPEITIWEGQQVMCIHNETGSFQNGTLCKVIEIYPDCVIARKANGRDIIIKKHKWPQYEYSYNPSSGMVEAEEIASVVQIGCKPAAASTIHKAQGLTLESVYMDITERWIPESGVYLGLSRCKSIDSIGLSRPISLGDINVLEEPMDFILSHR